MIANAAKGDVVPIPTLPPPVAKYAAPDEVRAVVDAYRNCEAMVDVAIYLPMVSESVELPCIEVPEEL